MESLVQIDGLNFWGNKDKDHRDNLRKIACDKDIEKLAQCKEFEIHITAWVSKNRNIGDTDNLFKVVIDAFGKKMIEKDKSQYVSAGIYEDDTVRYIKKVSAEIRDAEDGIEKTQIQIVGRE
jgi:Holliday junction resolvase RusA-like endonuclease